MIEFRMLGAVELKSADGHEVRSVLAQPKRVALLAYLAVNSTRGYVRRDTLLGVFWPELDEEHARGALNSAIYQLRRSLGSEVILSRGEELSLNEQEIRWDTALFERAAKAGDHAAAAELYRGELLQGWFVDDSPEFDMWLSSERMRLAAIAAKLPATTTQISPVVIKQIPVEPVIQLEARPRRRVWPLAFALLALIAGVGGVLALRKKTPLPRVLVTGFENRTGRADLDPIGDMSADWIAQGLAQADIIDVADRLLAARKPSKNLLDMAQQARASLLLSGAYYLRNGKLEVHASLYDVATQKVAAAFDPVIVPPESAIVAVQSLRDRAASAVAMALNVRVPASWTAGAASPPRYDAYLEYLRGITDISRRDFAAALPHFLAAGALDTTFTQANLHAAFASGLQRKLVQSDSLLSIVERRLDTVTPTERLFYDFLNAGRRNDGQAQVRAAIELARRAPDSQWPYVLANYAGANGLQHESLRLLGSMNPKSPALDGFYMYWYVLGMTLHALGDHRAELKATERGLKQYPGNTAIVAARVRALAALGRADEVVRELTHMTVPEWGPGAFNPGTVMATAAAELDAHGHPEAAAEARRMLQKWYNALPPHHLAEEITGVGLTSELWLGEAWPELAARVHALKLADTLRLEPLMYEAAVAAHNGDTTTARRTIDYIQSFSPEELRVRGGRNGPWLWRAEMAGLLGQPDSVFYFLKQNAANGQAFSLYFHTDPAFKTLRSSPEFRELLKAKD